ncbi:hypothetical protein EDB89DRAFT_1070316 [Lactarius sanguifluus]|nr:hypothetical protein EDB89DRAFT_1070316 [Lactarius sanguifluus]
MSLVRLLPPVFSLMCVIPMTSRTLLPPNASVEAAVPAISSSPSSSRSSTSLDGLLLEAMDNNFTSPSSPPQNPKLRMRTQYLDPVHSRSPYHRTYPSSHSHPRPHLRVPRRHLMPPWMQNRYARNGAARNVNTAARWAPLRKWRW